MSLLTNWGYTITESDELGSMLSEEEFNDFTAGKYTGDRRVALNISAASMAIRNYCGWHVYPSLSCEMQATFHDRRITRVGNDVLIQLPARYVSEVSSVMIDDIEYTNFVKETNGLLKVYGVSFGSIREYSKVSIEYIAGVPDELMYAITELIAHRVVHALASSSGVQSETAGGVSITYSANWINSARSTALADDNKEVLAPYRLQGVF